MAQTATNPKTGERIALIDGQWVPITQTATNPETKERLGLAGDQWIPLQVGKEKPGALDVAQSYTTDIPVRTAKGLLGGIEMGTNIFGADNPVSDILRGAQEGINEYLVSDTAKQRAEARSKQLEGKGFLGTIKEIPSILVNDPALLSEVFGAALPSLAAAYFSGGTSAIAQGTALVGTGAVMGMGAVKGSIYDATKNELMKVGVEEKAAEEAADDAQAYAGKNLDMIALGGILGGIASRTGMEPAAARMVAGRILGRAAGQSAGRETIETALTKAAEKAAGKGALRTAGTEAITEGAQGAQEQFAANLARQREGADVDIMEGVGSAAALEGTLGGILGGGFGVAAKRADIRQKLDEEAAADEKLTGSRTTAPEGFGRDEVEQRLRTAAGEDVFAGQKWASAVSKKLNNDIAFGTPEKIAESAAYIKGFQDQIDSGQVPEVEIEPLQRTLDEARTIINELQGTTSDVKQPDVGSSEAILGETGRTGAGGPEPSVSAVSGEVTATEPAAPTTELGGERLDVSGGAAQPTGSGETSKLGALAEQPATPPKPLAASMTLPEFETANSLVRKFNDRFADAPKITDFLKDTLGVDTVPENMNLGRAFELFQTKKNAAQRKLDRDFFDPITNTLKRERVSLPDFGTYLLARAAPDRNRVVREVNAAFPEGGSGMDDAEAAAVMADFKSRGLLPKLERAAKKHDELVDFMNEERVRAGILSRETAEDMRKAQPFYTPFKGFAAAGDMLTSDLQEDPHAEDRRQKLISEKRGLGMREFFQAKGRNSLPFHPLYNLFSDAETLARRTAMNDVYNTFLRMVEANPEGMKGFIKGIYTDTQPKKVTLVDKDNPAGRTFDANMQKEVINDRSRYHVVKDKGVTKYIEFSDSEAGQAAQRLFTNLQPQQVGQAMQIITGVNNALKALLTYRNPVYLSVVAPLRDTLDAVATAMLNRNIKGSPAYKKKLARKVVAYSTQPASWQTVTRYLLNREPVRGKEDLTALLGQMLSDGGAPMGVAFRTAQDRASAAVKELDWFRRQQEGDPLAVAREGAAKLGRFFDHWAEINDLVPRFATYRAAVEEGLTGPEAASLALDSSLNLTRRGEMSMLMDNLFPFFSASVEGTRKVGRIVTNPKTMTQVVGGMIAIGMAESLANAAIGGDEDDDGTPDYLDVNPGKKMTHLVLYYGKGGDDYINVPVGQMLGYFKYLGNKIADVWLGVQSGEEAGAAIQAASVDVVGGLVGLLSPARVQGGDIERTLVSLVPLWGKPVADLAINQNYFGTPIYQPEREETGPAAELGRATTAEAWKSIARGINEMTGGSPATGGYVNFQPEVYRYILQTYLGGWSRLGKQALDFAEEPSGGKVPIVRGFLGDGFDYVAQNKYQKNTAVLEKIVARIDKLSDAQLQREVKRHPTALDPRVISAYEDTEKALQKLYKQRREDLQTEDLTASDKNALLEYYRIETNKWHSAFNYLYDAVGDKQ